MRREDLALYGFDIPHILMCNGKKKYTFSNTICDLCAMNISTLNIWSKNTFKNMYAQL